MQLLQSITSNVRLNSSFLQFKVSYLNVQFQRLKIEERMWPAGISGGSFLMMDQHTNPVQSLTDAVK